MFDKVPFLAVGILAACTTSATPPLPDPAAAQHAWAQSCEDFDEWDKPGPPYRIYGETYYVGTCGISAILVADPKGHTLIDTGTDKGAQIVLKNIRQLGFEPEDVTTILMSHEHFDHIGGIARMQAATGAAIVTTNAASQVLSSGVPGDGDPQAGSGHPPFPPVTVPIDIIDPEMAETSKAWRFTPIFTPGHTPGALSWRWQECEGGDCKWIVYADSMNPISSDDYRFSDHPAYLAAFRQGIADLAASECDIVLAPHPGSAKLRDRLLGTAGLVDANGCRAYAENVTARLDKRLAEEAAK
ncbi:subclass B3 metallo-beta-lactamase [Qipengyuania zhejiangensis]|uniref:subclass B3 metallo-beta-lactamase n=1 Tax=Qipengyuania zhejiangensis TaxID=3077782 RepID=UPI002D78C841|nr:subclass B3 metallo-beta-lactamase [Qipengyuania sp. Z2]